MLLARADARLCGDTRGRDGRIRKKLAAGVNPNDCPLSGAKRTWSNDGVMSAYDAVDGAHSAASRCHRVVASKRTT
jgi:hypothetical protein